MELERKLQSSNMQKRLPNQRKGKSRTNYPVELYLKIMCTCIIFRVEATVRLPFRYDQRRTGGEY